MANVDKDLEADGKAGADGVQAVVLTLRILEQVAATRGSVGVTELASALDTTKSRIFRHLRTLVGQGYLSQSPPSDRYRAGPRLMTLGRMVGENTDLATVALRPMRELRDRLGHSCVLSTPEPDGVRIALTLSGHLQIEIGVRQGSTLGYHNSAQGKCAAAYLDQARREAILAGPLPASTPETITDPGVLRRHFAEIRAQGWATGANQAAIGLNALAAPILDGAGTLVGVLAAVNLVQFIPDRPAEAEWRAVTQAAREISVALGWSPEPD
ncbi:IclR family transcriptional regulator [Frigidibacter sp. MR17.14]|uniref:IclR family transcriptional regulator n=1 Tax=Frigidibacter sp. MR17.14 TaxID=3126509 RepID=UPI003012A679